jgi:hypothetical protein
LRKKIQASSMKKTLKTWVIPGSPMTSRAVENVEEQGFQHLGVPAHALEIETLEAGKGEDVFRVIEQEAELAPGHPLLQPPGGIPRQGVGQRAQRPQVRLDLVQVLDLLIKLLRFFRRQPGLAVRFRQDLDEHRQKIEVRLRGRKRKRIDPEVRRIDSHAHVGAAEQLRQALVAAAQVENECVRFILLKIRREEADGERFP